MTTFNNENKMETNQIQKETLTLLLDLERQFREHHSLVKNQMQLQKQLTARLWTVSQRYSLMQSDPCNRHPEGYPSPPDVLLQEYSKKLLQIQNSNCLTNASLAELRITCIAFESLCYQLDMTDDNPLITGGVCHKPLSYFIEIVSDLFKYFHSWVLKLRYSSRQLDPYKVNSVERYIQLLEISEEFEEYLKVCLTYCKCLSSNVK